MTLGEYGSFWLFLEVQMTFIPHLGKYLFRSDAIASSVGRLGRLIRSPLGRPPPGAVTVTQNIFQNVGYREIIAPYRI